MAEVEITPEALEQLAQVPRLIQRRIRNVFVRLTFWPEVSGVKALRGEMANSYRIRTGGYRVVFRVQKRPRGDALITVSKIGYRGDVYD